MSEFLKVYQVYFDESQKKDLDYIPHLNENCTVFFENEVIKNLIESGAHSDCEYFGVVSYNLKKKLNEDMKLKWAHIPNVKNNSANTFTPALFEVELRKYLPDVMSFQKHTGHEPITYANNFHPNFSKYFSEIMKKIGYDWKPVKFENIFLCNNFVAKKDVYERYVTEMLAPAMEVMLTMPELMKNSMYGKPLPDNLKKSFGVNWFPYHTFLAERFFSYFCHIHKLNCKHF